MAKIKPFKGYLPNPNMAKIISSPPYDVISSDEARKVVQNNNYSFLRVIKPEIDFASTKIPNKKTLHQHAAKNLGKFIQLGRLNPDKIPCFYIYKIIMGKHAQVGVIAGVSIKEYQNNLIRKHELTRPDKEDDRTQHIHFTNANTGPVFLTYKTNTNISDYINKIIIENAHISFVSDDSSIHSIWKIDAPKIINSIQNYFKSVSVLYIADGHHRAASAAKVQRMKQENNPNHTGNEPYNYFLAAIFPHNSIQILPYNRIIKDLNGLSKTQFISLIETKFFLKTLSEAELPNKRNIFTMYLDGKWFKLEAKDCIIPDDVVSRLDASIIQEHIFASILNIHDPRTNNRIEFVGGIKSLDVIEKKCNSGFTVGFVLYPISIDELFIVADLGEIMPPKSTWFEPKLRSGLVVRLLD